MSLNREAITQPPVETNKEKVDVPGTTKEKAFDENAKEARALLQDITKGKSPILVKRILDRFEKECGLDDGIIGSDDGLSKLDAVKIPEQLPTNLLPYDHALDETPGDAFPLVGSKAPRYVPSLVADGKIDQEEYQKFVESFSQNAEKITNEVKNEPLYKEEIGDMKVFPGVNEALEGVTDEGMRTLLLEQIKKDILYSEAPKTLSQAESYLKEFKTNRKDYMKWCRLSTKRENLGASEKLIFEKLRKNISTNFVEKIAKEKVDNIANKYSPWGLLVKTKDFTPQISGRNSLLINISDANLSVRIPEEFFLETGLDVQESKTFIENNWNDILGSITLANKLNQSFEEKEKTEYPSDPSVARNEIRVKNEKASVEEATAQAELAAAQEEESAREQARTSANESFINTVTTEDYAALGITLTGRETLDEKINTIQEKLIEKGQTVSSSGIADKWAGPRTIAALKNIRTEYAQNIKEQKSKSPETKPPVTSSKKETTPSTKEISPTNKVSVTYKNGEHCDFNIDPASEEPEEFSYLEDPNNNLSDRIFRDKDNNVYIKSPSDGDYINNTPTNFNVKFVKKGGTWTAESGKWNTDSTGTILDIKKLEAQRQAAEEERAARDLAIQEEQFSHEASLANKKG